MRFDAIGIGTGPLTLIRAMRLAEKGHRVLLCDRGADLGGAWSSPAVLGFENVEVGVHLLENRPAFRHALCDGLQIPMARDRCVARAGRWTLPMAPARVLLHAAIAAKSLRRQEADKARRSLLSAWRSARNMGASFYYPPSGASQILHAVSTRLRHLGGEVRFGVSVTQVALCRSGVNCETSHGTLGANRVLISSRAFAPVSIDGVTQDLEIERGYAYSAVLHLHTDMDTGNASDRETASHSYLEIINDAHIKRVRDIGMLSRPSPAPGELLLCVQYRGPWHGDDESLGGHLQRHLKRLAIIKEGARLLGIYRSDLEITTLTDNTLTRLRRSSAGRIEAIESTDFAEGFISANAKRAPSEHPPRDADS